MTKTELFKLIDNGEKYINLTNLIEKNPSVQSLLNELVQEGLIADLGDNDYGVR